MYTDISPNEMSKEVGGSIDIAKTVVRKKAWHLGLQNTHGLAFYQEDS